LSHSHWKGHHTRPSEGSVARTLGRTTVRKNDVLDFAHEEPPLVRAKRHLPKGFAEIKDELLKVEGVIIIIVFIFHQIREIIEQVWVIVVHDVEFLKEGKDVIREAW
jgi:hypothetical protein